MLRASGPSGGPLTRRLPAIVVTVIGIVFLVPFVWLVVAALQSHATLEVSGGGPLTTRNFTSVLHGGLLSALGNSIYLAVGTTVFTTAIGVVAGYPLSRFPSRLQELFVYLLVFLTSLPVIALMIPAYDFFVTANLINSRFWTVWFLTATSLPFATWIARSFIDAVPRELEEAAWLDGISRWGSLVRLVVPLILPGIGVIAIFTFVNAWSNFFVPFILLQGGNEPAAVTIYNYFGQYGIDYGRVAAFAVVYSLPPVVLYLLVSKWTGRGFALGGALKG